MVCGSKTILLLTEDGKLYSKSGSEKCCEILTNVKDISCYSDSYGAYTSASEIFIWKEGQEPVQMMINPHKFRNFIGISVGNGYGHVIDKDLNLYGWGENKYG